METTINSFIDWMANIGIPVTHSITITRIIAIVLILVAALIVDKICRKIIIPAIRKITAKTESDLDNHILSDEVLNNICRLVPPIVIAALTPYALFTAPMLQTFIMKFCYRI